MLDRSQGTSCPEKDTRFDGRVAIAGPQCSYKTTWQKLAPLLAARRSMRVVEADGRFGNGKTLAVTPPIVPAAVPIYRGGYTRVLALDFDAKHHSPAQVISDVNRALAWIAECGGTAVTDRSTSGGQHVLVPLSAGAPLRVEHVKPLMHLLAARLVTLDVTPMLNASSGCITPPGSACREGGFRQLVGSLDDAVNAFTVRSEAGLVARMTALLGGAVLQPGTTAVRRAMDALHFVDKVVGSGHEARLHPSYCRRSPIPEPVSVYAATGVLDRSRWSTHSEARQSVISHAVLRGASVEDVLEALMSPEWLGMRHAYDRYRTRDDAVARDVRKAMTWAASVADEFRKPTHKKKHTGGDVSFQSDSVRRAWLACAELWADREFRGARCRPGIRAVLQALAYSSALAGEVVHGVPVVAIGGRSLSYAAGMMQESTVWALLRLLRDTPGSPVLLVARGAGQNADRYALTTPDAPAPTEIQYSRSKVEPVHSAWSMLGLRARGVYEAISNGTASTAQEAFVVAGVGQSSGYEVLGDLVVAGLVIKVGGQLSLGSRTLDDISEASGVASVIDGRVVRHRAERVVWRAWLEARFAPPPPDEDTGEREVVVSSVADAWHIAEVDEYLSAVLSTGPPVVDETAEALELLADYLGARVLST